MKALSIRQPWAWAILSAGKDIENRDWTTNLRERIIIHASKTFDWEGYLWLQRHGHNPPNARQIPTGCLVGEVEITDCLPVEQVTDNHWAFGPNCLMLANPKTYDTPIPHKGQLGFFDTKEEVNP